MWESSDGGSKGHLDCHGMVFEGLAGVQKVENGVIGFYFREFCFIDGCFDYQPPIAHPRVV